MEASAKAHSSGFPCVPDIDANHTFVRLSNLSPASSIIDKWNAYNCAPLLSEGWPRNLLTSNTHGSRLLPGTRTRNVFSSQAIYFLAVSWGDHGGHPSAGGPGFPDVHPMTQYSAKLTFTVWASAHMWHCWRFVTAHNRTGSSEAKV